MKCSKPILVLATLWSSLLAAGVSSPGPLTILKIDGPAWIAKDSPFDGRVTLERVPGLTGVRCDFSVDGKVRSVECKSDGTSATYSFTIPPLNDAKSNSVSLTFHAQSPDGGIAYESKPHLIALADVTELDITGAAADVLKFPLKAFGLNAEFIPCCNISGGITRVERIPVNPEPNPNGLPARLVSPFLRATPCAMSVASAGLGLELLVDAALTPKPVFANVKAYRWHENSWKPVLNTTSDEARGAISFHIPDGGTFVLGEERAAH